MGPHRGVSLTQVYPSPAAAAETDIDIIAIHGLDTKSLDTWVWKSKLPYGDVNWLASPQMLPGRVGRARIFTCDWPSDLFEQPDLIQKTTEEFARLLLAGISQRPLPKSSHSKRKDPPIVFVASCLGGIILMNALLIADHTLSEYTVIRRSTRGIVFLATPFRGTSFQDVANWAEPGLRAWALIRGQKSEQPSRLGQGIDFPSRGTCAQLHSAVSRQRLSLPSDYFLRNGHDKSAP